MMIMIVIMIMTTAKWVDTHLHGLYKKKKWAVVQASSDILEEHIASIFKMSESGSGRHWSNQEKGTCESYGTVEETLPIPSTDRGRGGQGLYQTV
jgi:hypothetical protein